MNVKHCTSVSMIVVAVAMLVTSVVRADPCGMIPPIYAGPGRPIERIGHQMTYVFYRDGVETFVIRPGFQGKVDEFGMLIPFPSPPAARKVDDDIFAHIGAAIDPPEVVVDVNAHRYLELDATAMGGGGGRPALALRRDGGVRVISEEAVGMYQVAVLEAGSARALQAWLDRHGYQYPEGMDGVCNEYVDAGWCFVAIKTQVGRRKGVDPRPGMREADATMPASATFDGHVQAMGFRFRVDRPVVPMRLSAFNEGDPRNIVYILSDEPVRIVDIPAKYVSRQVPGARLIRNLTEPLPLRIIGGSAKDIPAWELATLPARRDPKPHNGLAAELFASDLLAASENRLAHRFEELEKELLRIGERLDLRGADLDDLHHEAVAALRREMLDEALASLEGMTLTVVDGDFPRDVIARQNLAFAGHRIAAARNTPRAYEATVKGPSPERPGHIVRTSMAATGAVAASPGAAGPVAVIVVLAGVVLISIAVRRGGGRGLVVLGGVATALAATGLVTAEPPTGPDHASLIATGWAIVALAESGDGDADEELARILVDGRRPALVRTWAAAARMRRAQSLGDLMKLAPLADSDPALRRPLAKRVQALVVASDTSLEGLIRASWQYPTLRVSLVDAIMSHDPEALVELMTRHDDDGVRRSAASYLATMGQQGRPVAPAVIEAYRFDLDADGEPWKGGALYVPSIDWSPADARSLACELISWMGWADGFGRTDLVRQLHNNLVSVGLTRVAGYAPPAWRDDVAAAWERVGRTLCGRVTDEGP